MSLVQILDFVLEIQNNMANIPEVAEVVIRMKPLNAK